MNTTDNFIADYKISYNAEVANIISEIIRNKEDITNILMTYFTLNNDRPSGIFFYGLIYDKKNNFCPCYFIADVVGFSNENQRWRFNLIFTPASKKVDFDSFSEEYKTEIEDFLVDFLGMKMYEEMSVLNIVLNHYSKYEEIPPTFLTAFYNQNDNDHFNYSNSSNETIH